MLLLPRKSGLKEGRAFKDLACPTRTPSGPLSGPLPITSSDSPPHLFLREGKEGEAHPKEPLTQVKVRFAETISDCCACCPLFPLKSAKAGRKSLRKLFVQTVFIWVGVGRLEFSRRITLPQKESKTSLAQKQVTREVTEASEKVTKK